MSRAALVLVLIAVAALFGFGGYRFAMHRMPDAQTAAPAPGQPERKPLYWYDPMYPQQKFDKPGKSPFMDMQLVPKYADETGAEAGTVWISPQVVQNLGVRTAAAVKGSLEQKFEAVGAVAYNERGVVQLQARSAGFVEKLHARAPLDPVAKGAPLVDILFPEWAGAQEEYLLLRRQQSADMGALVAAARQRLALLGMSEAEIAVLERDGKPRTRMTLTSPIAGVIAELSVREGMTVAAGAPLFRIVNLATVWVNAEVPEVQAGIVQPDTPVEARVAAYPEAVFKGRVGAILPEVNPATRTLRARIELANPDGRLKPGMYATLIFSQGKAREAVLVPSEAVIRTGERNVVIVALGDGKFRAAEVMLGAEAGGRSEIRKGLVPGDQVVLSGQFLLDSEASLSGAIARMEQSTHRTRGTITNLDVGEGRVEMEHEPVPALKWPRMTMEFTMPDKSQLGRFKKGDRVEFEFRGQPESSGDYVIERISPSGGGGK